mmetsp:Transcript_24314/g.61658  ORF Transcript_24314/g.61658 Transcript_24314/m.61658 type:complete len:136 (+) Transcript_24314:1426-1833(+)
MLHCGGPKLAAPFLKFATMTSKVCMRLLRSSCLDDSCEVAMLCSSTGPGTDDSRPSDAVRHLTDFGVSPETGTGNDTCLCDAEVETSCRMLLREEAPDLWDAFSRTKGENESLAFTRYPAMGEREPLCFAGGSAE